MIRAHYNGDFVPGKFASNSRAAYIPHGGKEVPVHNFEVNKQNLKRHTMNQSEQFSIFNPSLLLTGTTSSTAFSSLAAE